MNSSRHMLNHPQHLHNSLHSHPPPPHHPQLQQHNSLPGNYSTPPHLDLSLNSTLSSDTFPYNAVMPSNEIISCPLNSNNYSSGTTSTSALFFKSVSGGGGSSNIGKSASYHNNSGSTPVKLKSFGSVFRRIKCRNNSKTRNPKQSLDKTNSYLLWIGTPVAAR